MDKSNLVVDETVSGVYFYHIKEKGTFKPICGIDRQLLGKDLPLTHWGLRGHLQEKYCKECDKLMREI